MAGGLGGLAEQQRDSTARSGQYSSAGGLPHLRSSRSAKDSGDWNQEGS